MSSDVPRFAFYMVVWRDLYFTSILQSRTEGGAVIKI